jgi:hypothetical protein
LDGDIFAPKSVSCTQESELNIGAGWWSPAQGPALDNTAWDIIVTDGFEL